MRKGIAGLMVLGLLACEELPEVYDPVKQLAADIVTIDNYLASQGIDAVEDPSGLRYVIHTVGTGETPTLNHCIRVTYTGKLLTTGEIFETRVEGDYGTKNFMSVPLGQFIQGWKIGLKLMPVGSSATLYIPSVLGYQNNESKDSSGKVIIPKNSNLIFEIDLLAIGLANPATAACN
jgi:FKBP-type peptidyl-prolyl cis-trans isomerase